MTCHQLFHNWFIGNVKENIPAFKTLTSNDLHHVKGGLEARVKMQGFIMRVEAISREFQPSSRIAWPKSVTGLNVGEITKLWGDVGPKVYE